MLTKRSGGRSLSPFSRVVLPTVSPRHVDSIVLALLAAWMIGLMAILTLGHASHLLGAFLAGLSFCTIRSLHNHTWKGQARGCGPAAL